MIGWVLENKLCTIGIVLLLLIVHQLFVKPIQVLLYYKRQGVSVWKFFPLIGPVVLNILRDGKKHGDVIYSQKMIHIQNKGKIVNAEVSNIVARANLILFDPALIQDFFVNKNSCYEKSKLGETLAKTLFGEGILFSEGDRWKKARRITSKLLTFEFLNSYIPMIQGIVENELNRLDLSSNVELITTLETITGNISLSIFFGRTIENETLEGIPIAKYMKDLHSQSLKVFLHPLFLLTGGKVMPKEFVRRSSLVKQSFQRLVREELEKQDGSKNSLVRLYAKEDNYIGGQPPVALVEDISNQILNFYIAGRDTTSHLVLMFLYYYTQNPLLADRLKSELSPLFGKSNLIWDDLKNRTYFEAFIKETLRIYGPAIGIQAREAISTHKLGNITVLKGTYVGIGMAANSYNPRYFADPMIFNPDRWLNQVLEEQFAFIPFSAGNRNCIGQHLSALMAKILITRILANFQIDLEEGYVLKFVLTSTYAPQGPLRFSLKRLGGV